MYTKPTRWLISGILDSSGLLAARFVAGQGGGTSPPPCMPIPAGVTRRNGPGSRVRTGFKPYELGQTLFQHRCESFAFC